ncbi:hypothetical protein Vadar_021495 [Vaccinium darrowii]|uniref:Uncharacterized protein n=1 Tax=Vaccinium darrowii TaxID=229202 RepID=A0ACB7YNR5_9ERIC|nr:hypothetical protein Vadar_021495 [Vaccinium darrowii]
MFSENSSLLSFSSIENEASAESHQTEAVEEMPAPDRSGYLDMVTRLIGQMRSLRSDESGSRSGQCTSDKHYIVFFDAPSDEICDCCVLPISAPYYNCPECHLILHKSCAAVDTDAQALLFIVLFAAPSSILISSVPHYRQQSNTKLTSTSSAFRNKNLTH